MNEQQAIGKMFDRIAKTYDLVNRVLSFRQDVRWRESVAATLPTHKNLAILDIATGTADLLITMLKRCATIKKAIGIDIAPNMLKIGEKKLKSLGIANATLIKADACDLPFNDSSFDVITIAFGIRNIPDADRALLEMSRVLKPDGQLIVLEFSLPKNPLLRACYLFYFRFILPLIGGIYSGDFFAYRYLNRSVLAFPTPAAFAEILSSHGFKTVVQKPLSCGIATMYCARKS